MNTLCNQDLLKRETQRGQGAIKFESMCLSTLVRLSRQRLTCKLLKKYLSLSRLFNAAAHAFAGGESDIITRTAGVCIHSSDSIFLNYNFFNQKLKLQYMENQTLEIKAALQILKPVSEVFEAIVDPVKMSNYFISKSSGRMEEGKKLIWRFPEFDMEFPVRVGKIENDKYISYYWDSDDGKELFVEMTLTPKESSSTVVTITEKSRNNDEEGIKWLKGNTEGWANFLACLKAYLEYGINLRKGAFDFMKS